METNNNNVFADCDFDLNIFYISAFLDVLQSDNGCVDNKNQFALMQQSYGHKTKGCDCVKTINVIEMKNDKESKT